MNTSKLNKITICPTPIGNLGDVSERLFDTLQAADIIYAEDTRVTSKLLNKLKIKTKLLRLDENVMDDKIEAVLSQSGNIAYCTDAGTPGVSDPGLKLVKIARENNIDVEVLPGPCAAITAYVASGFNGQSFYFGGFMPRKEQDKIHALNKDCIQIYYESPKRLKSTLSTIAKYLPDRQIAVCRELTKIHEEVLIGPACKLIGKVNYLGEIVIVINGASKEETEKHYQQKLKDIQELDLTKLSSSDTTKFLKMCGIKKNDAYKISISKN